LKFQIWTEIKFYEILKTCKSGQAKRKQDITHEEAIAIVAKRIMDSNRRFKVIDARDIMLAAGYFSKNPAKAYNNLSTPLRRSNKFKLIEPGVYELIDTENSKGDD